MPNYDYKCKSCGNIFEVFQSMKDEPLKECPQCGGEIIRLIGGGLSPIFKGNGFYITDYKKKSSEKPSNSEKPIDNKPKESPTSPKSNSESKDKAA